MTVKPTPRPATPDPARVPLDRITDQPPSPAVARLLAQTPRRPAEFTSSI
ncbi:hypothetical protein [Streptomyces stelliscabiei]